jgi:hypothetical protein
MNVPPSGNDNATRHLLRLLFILAVLISLSLVIALQRWHTYNEPLEHDLTLYAVFGHELLNGRPLYSDLWDNKPPGIFVTYAAAEKIAGYGPGAIYLLGVLGAIVTMLGLYAAGSALTGKVGVVSYFEAG